MRLTSRAFVLAALSASAALAAPTSPFVTILDVISGLSAPVGIVSAGPNDPRLFIVEQTGKIRILESGALLTDPFIDLGSTGLNLILCCGERGLLGLAFHPNYASNGFFYVYYTRASDGDIVVARYTVSGDPDVADTTSGSIVLIQDHPAGNHNGGGMAFGTDGYLYLSLGDGGGGGDPDERAQDVTWLLGKILRLDIDGADAHPANPDRNYAIPGDNPYVGIAGEDEIWTVGLRNPWRISFDRVGGRLFIGDVGQGNWEEIDVQPPLVGGLNFGWDCYEGPLLVDPEPDDGPDEENCDASAEMLGPILEYPNPPDGPAAVTGGYVYRGGSSAAIYGNYIFADFYSGVISRGIQSGGNWTDEVLAATERLISTFGEDNEGKLYFADYAGSIHRIAPYSFSDVSPAGAVGWTDIETLYLHEVSLGCATGRYCPDGGIQRQQAAPLVLRARDPLASPPTDCTPPYSDVAADAYCVWIEELENRGATAGCGGGKFCPTDPLTRGVLARWLLRVFDWPGATPLPPCSDPGPFADVEETHPFCTWIQAAATRGVLDACESNTRFCPDDPVRRDQLASVLVKVFTLQQKVP